MSKMFLKIFFKKLTSVIKIVPIASKLVSELQTVDVPFCNKNKMWLEIIVCLIRIQGKISPEIGFSYFNTALSVLSSNKVYRIIHKETAQIY